MLNSDLKGTNITIVGNEALEDWGGGGYLDGSEWSFMNTVIVGNTPDIAYFKEPDGSSISMQYSGISGSVRNGEVDLSQGNLAGISASMDYTFISMESDNFTIYSYCDRIPGWGTFLGEYIFWKNTNLDKGNPDSQYNDADWRYCLEGNIPRKVTPSSLDETPDSNYVRNDMGAYGGQGGNWLPIGYKVEPE